MGCAAGVIAIDNPTYVATSPGSGAKPSFALTVHLSSFCSSASSPIRLCKRFTNPGLGNAAEGALAERDATPAPLRSGLITALQVRFSVSGLS